MGQEGSGSEQAPENLEPREGIAIRLGDGNVYFVRKEILDACRVTEEEELKLVESAIEGSDEVSGFLDKYLVEKAVWAPIMTGKHRPPT